MRPKIEKSPLPEGYTRIRGQSVEDVLKVLEEKGITKLLCSPMKNDFRGHLIILTRSDYERLIKEGDLGKPTIYGGSFSDRGLNIFAKYQLDDYSRLEPDELEVPFPE